MSWLIEWIRKILSIEPKTSKMELNEAKNMQEAYQKIDDINFTAIIANKLAKKTVANSDFSVGGNNKRAQWLLETLSRVWDRMLEVTSMSYGLGGVVLLPYIIKGKGFINIVPQSLFVVNQTEGDDIISACVVAENFVSNSRKYYRVTEYKIENGNYIIRNKAFIDTREVDINSVPKWAEIPKEIVIRNVNKMLFAYLICPTDSRRASFGRGVSITYGAESLIAEAKNILIDIADEYKLKKPMVAISELAFEDDKNKLPSIFKVFPGVDSSDFWQLFNPDIRDVSLFSRLNVQLELIEKSIGVSEGILTKPNTDVNAKTATEIKANQYDTFVTVASMRKNIDRAMNDLAYSFNVLCNYYEINPIGEYNLSFDWDLSLMENAAETWLQLKEGQSIGAVSKAEIRQFLKGGTLKEAQDYIDDLKEREPDLKTLLGG